MFVIHRLYCTGTFSLQAFRRREEVQPPRLLSNRARCRLNCARAIERTGRRKSLSWTSYNRDEKEHWNTTTLLITRKKTLPKLNTNVCASVSHTVNYESKNVLTMQEKQESAMDKNCSSDGEINTLSNVLIKRKQSRLCCLGLGDRKYHLRSTTITKYVNGKSCVRDY